MKNNNSTSSNRGSAEENKTYDKPMVCLRSLISNKMFCASNLEATNDSYVREEIKF